MFSMKNRNKSRVPVVSLASSPVHSRVRLGSSTNANTRNSENNPMALLTKNGMPVPLTTKLPSHGILNVENL